MKLDATTAKLQNVMGQLQNGAMEEESTSTDGN
jgi:hypothetical protein